MDQPRPTRPPGRHSLAVRLAMVWALVLGTAVGISSWIAHQDASDRYIDGLEQSVTRDASVIRLRLETWMRDFQEAARSTSRSPLLAEFLDARGTVLEPRWRQLVEREFRAGFAGKPDYFQMRLLAVGEGERGQELLRLDRVGDVLAVTPDDRLQGKAERPYFKEALDAPRGSIYLSGIDLNRDFGTITEPHIPTVRAASVVAGAGGREAMLVINADLRRLFGELRGLAADATEVRLADGGGDYILHPDPAVVFATDLGHGARWDGGGMAGQAGGREGAPLAVVERVPLGGAVPRTLWLSVSIPEGAWQPVLAGWKRRGIWATLSAAVAGVFVAALISLPFVSRLRRLSHALREFDGTVEPAPLAAADRGEDEIGVAIRRFREMAMKVREQVEGLRAARDRAEAADAAKENFLAVMSHEIRTPMNAVVGLIRALEQNDPPPHQEPILASLKASSSNLMTLLNTALDFTRLREGAIHYASAPFDSALVVREVAGALAPLALGKGIDLEVDAPGALVAVGDAVRFRQIVNNLVGNAVKFTGDGSVRITLSHDGGDLVFTVADSGPGVDAGEREAIFEPFVTGRAGVPHAEVGAGLGLAVSKQMAEQQGGELVLERSGGTGGGATFVLRLPYATGEAAGAGPGELNGGPAAVARALPALPPGLRLLYVEDVASNREVMELALRHTGADLTLAGSGAEARELLGRREFDMVLVDLQLPDLTGDELAREIRRDKPGVPVVAVTAQSSAGADARLTRAGVAGVVLKPYTADELLGEIARHATVRRPNGAVSRTLECLHPSDARRRSRLARTVAGDLRTAADALRDVHQSGDAAAVRRSARDIRHRLTTAVAQFELTELGSALERLAPPGSRAETTSDPTSGGGPPPPVDRAVALLRHAAAELDNSARAPAPPPAEGEEQTTG